MSGKRDSNADAYGQHPDFPESNSQETSGLATPHQFQPVHLNYKDYKTKTLFQNKWQVPVFFIH